MNDEKLLDFYLALRDPEAGPWNLAPETLYFDVELRSFIKEQFGDNRALNVCNVGIGTGEWDDYLGYFFSEGSMTSFDIDRDICDIFAYRQSREGHPNPSRVICENILDTTLPADVFDLVTIVGSTVKEIGDYEGALAACFRLVKPDGSVIYMDFERYHPRQRLVDWISETTFAVEVQKSFNRFQDHEFYIYRLKKSRERNGIQCSYFLEFERTEHANGTQRRYLSI